MKNIINAGELLFSRGFAFYPSGIGGSSAVWRDLQDWRIQSFGPHTLCCHPQATLTYHVHDGCAVILVGNAVNPYAQELEPEIVKRLLEYVRVMPEGARLSEDLIGYINQLTGRFQLLIIKDNEVFALCDATALAPLYFNASEKGCCFSSHSQLMAELLGAERDHEMQEIIESSFYTLGRRHLPGYKSPYKNVELVGANVYYSTREQRRVRFYPRDPLAPGSLSFEDLVEESAAILKRSALLYLESRPVLVSLSLGQDSRISLSAFHDWNEKIGAYSYCGNSVETDEARKVHYFAGQVGVRHEIIITDEVDEEECRLLAGLLDRSTAYMRKHKMSEIRKLVAMSHWYPAGAMEIKGEASEIGRATYSKRTGIKNFPEIDVRAMSNLYKRVLYPRHLLKCIDGCFESFSAEGGFGFSRLGYNDYDMFFWEHRTACCVSLGMQDHDFYHDASALMNNRLLLDKFLVPTFEDRLADRMHQAVCEKLWPGILSVPTSQRSSVKARAKMLMENVFFRLNRFNAKPGA